MFKNILDLPQISEYSPMHNAELFYSIQYTVKSIDENDEMSSIKDLAIHIYESLNNDQIHWLQDIKDEYKCIGNIQAQRIVFAQESINYAGKVYELNKDIVRKYSALIEDLPF